jgi:hypothetical protein
MEPNARAGVTAANILHGISFISFMIMRPEHHLDYEKKYETIRDIQLEHHVKDPRNGGTVGMWFQSNIRPSGILEITD